MMTFLFFLFFSFSSVFSMGIRIVGNQFIGDEAIRAAAQFPSSDDVDAWNQTVKRLYQTGWFDAISVDVQPDHAVVTVKEYPPLLAYKADSRLDQLKPEKLVDMLSSSGIKRGQPLAEHRIEQWRLGALQELKRMGYEDPKISYTLEPQQDGVVLDIYFDGGTPTLVRRILVEGRPGFKESEILALLNVKADGFWRRFDHANQISLEKNKMIEESLRVYYETHGYFNPNIKVYWQDVPKGSRMHYVDLVVDIVAGPVSKITAIQAVGQCGVLPELLGQLKGQIYDHDAVQQQIMQSGSLTESVQVRMQPRLTAQGVEVILICHDVPSLTVGDIEVMGNGTDDLLLRSFLDFKEGDVWRSSWLASSKRRLLGQPYITNADIILKPRASDPSIADVTVVVEENKKNTMASFRLNYEQGGGGFGLGGGFSNKNFLGTGNALSLEGQYNSAMWFTDLQLAQPLVPHQAAALMGFSFRVSNQDKLNLGQYKQDLASAYYGYRWLLTDQLLFQSQVSLRANHFVVYNQQAINLTDELDVYGYEPVEFAWSNTLLRDARDRAERTTSGYVAKLGTSVVVPVFENMMAYFQLSPSLTAYYELARAFQQPIVLRGNVVLGYGQSYGQFSGNLPFYNRYYAGGIGTVRGYNLFSLGPKYTDQYGNPRAVGGNWLSVANVDVLLPSPYPDFLQPSLFVDAGNVYLDKIDLGQLRYSAGLSTAISTPFMQLTVSCATFFNQADERYSGITVEMGRQF